jgi:glycosyltransferase involved in cell wall biosynthesis
VRILWTVANWKRTGPVEPSLDLAAAVAARGHEVLVATGRPVGTAPDEGLFACAARGLARLDLGLRLSKHRSPLSDLRDAARLADHLRAIRPDVVTTTLPNDHRTVAAAVGRSGLDVPVLRLWFADGGVRPRPREAARLRAAAAVLPFGEGPARALAAAGVAADRIVRIDPPLDVERLRRVAPAREEVRARHGAGPGTLLAGVVARVQTHRRFELLWEAAALLRERGIPLRLLVVGRGTRFDEVAAGPVARAGLDGVVAFTGYLRGDAYVRTLSALDAQVFLVPGSDPTCRALREGMALGVPSVATRRGLLPEIVGDGETGLLVEESPDSLASALARLAGDAGLRARLSEGAARRADRFAPARAAAAWEAATARATA